MRATVVWGGLLFAVFLLQLAFAVVPHQDDLAILDTGLNLLERGRYEEFSSSSHRGVLGAVLYAAAYRATGDVAVARNVIAAGSAALAAVGLLLLARRIGARPEWLAPAMFAAFPFVSWALNASSIHLVQGALLVGGLLALDRAAERPTPGRSLIVGLLAGAGPLAHAISLVFAPLLLAGLALIVARSGLGRRRAAARLATAVAGCTLVIGLQVAAVAAASGRLGLSTQDFAIFSRWNPIHAEGAADVAAGPSYQELAGRPAPASIGEWLGTVLTRPRFFIRFHLSPALATAGRMARQTPIALVWLPCLLIGSLAARRSAAMRRYALALLGCAALTLLVTTLVAEERYWLPCLIASTPLAAAGLGGSPKEPDAAPRPPAAGSGSPAPRRRWWSAWSCWRRSAGRSSAPFPMPPGCCRSSGWASSWRRPWMRPRPTASSSPPPPTSKSGAAT